MRADLVSNASSVVQGVNTARTVQANNLAVLEQVLNFAVNCLTVGLPILGAYFVYRTFRGRGTATVGKQARGYVTGVSLILLGLMIPGTINWFVASGCGSIFSPKPVFY